MLFLDFILNVTKKTRLFNSLISFVALKIYKYKMFCRLESLDETEYNLINYVNKCTTVLKLSKYDLGIDVVENITQLLCDCCEICVFLFTFCIIYICIEYMYGI